jgi:hypothetical protein
LQNKKIKNEIKRLFLVRFGSLKKEIYNGRICKRYDTREEHVLTYGIMFEKKSTVIQCYVTPAILGGR